MITAEFLGLEANVAGIASLLINTALLLYIITYSIAKVDYPFAGTVRRSSSKASEFDRSKVGYSTLAVAEIFVFP